MSLFPEFLPIINEGMSVITAICLFFLSSGMIVMFTFLFSRCKSHDEVLTDIWEDLTIMKVDIAETTVVVERIESSLSELGTANKEIIKILLKK